MGQPGKLTKDKFGFSMPVDSPLYGRLPVLYKGVSMLIYEYVTSADAAAALLPAQLELAAAPNLPPGVVLPPGTALATLLFAEYSWSTIGPYNEVAQAIPCTYKGTPMTYAVRLHVTTDRALAAGRECGGFAKKLGDIPFRHEVSYASWLERPAGVRICSGVLEPGAPSPDKRAPIEFVSLRLMPNIAAPDTPSLCQLMHTRWLFDKGEMWTGAGSFSYDAASDLDPYYKLPCLKQLAALLYLGEMEVSDKAEILENF